MDQVLTCYFLTNEEAVAFRDWYWPYLQLAIDDSEGRIDPEAVWKEIAESRAAVFVVTDDNRNLKCAATFTVHDNAHVRWGEIELCGGEGVEDWLKIGIAAIERYATYVGCEYVLLEGRKGWERSLRKLGFETRRIQAVLRLN